MSVYTLDYIVGACPQQEKFTLLGTNHSHIGFSPSMYPCCPRFVMLMDVNYIELWSNMLLDKQNENQFYTKSVLQLTSSMYIYIYSQIYVQTVHFGQYICKTIFL